MIAGIFHPGSGLGNQLFRYVATRVLAEDRGYDFGMINPEGFKGKDFMEIDMGKQVPVGHVQVLEGGYLSINSDLKRFEEKKIVENGVDVRSFDPEWAFVEDNTIIDGEFQDEKYFYHKMMGHITDATTGKPVHGAYGPLSRWLETPVLAMPNDVCVIGFRGGEFQFIPELFLTRDYWETAITLMREVNPQMRFIAVTDDPTLAAAVLPREVKVTHDIATDWRMVRNAKYLIISNSSFYILPSLLNNHVKKVIAPRYWARRNTGVWALPSNYYSDKRWQYI